MDQITLKNFRCFREEQTARLAPLTLLVGENSTGKTSFMAMIRALWDAVHGFRPPDFKEEPYDLGSFDDITHYRGGRLGRAETFEAAFQGPLIPTLDGIEDGHVYRFKATFGKRETAPALIKACLSRGNTWFEAGLESAQPATVRLHTCRGTWETQVPYELSTQFSDRGSPMYLASYVLNVRLAEGAYPGYSYMTPQEGSPQVTDEDLASFRDLVFTVRVIDEERPFATSPVRSKPRRTYDPARLNPDPEGDYVPMYLASVLSQDTNNQVWKPLKERLEDFGRAAGLFDEIAIKQLGERGSGPFQIHVRKAGGRLKGPQRNLIDVGYGVSQALPIIVELLRRDAPSMFLLQQPEVHLHPKAQAALGSLFCQVAGPERQLIIETHSDHLLDRVRMDVRDGASELKPEDVSILFFERDDLDVRIHSLRIDKEGNIIDAPDSYRRFFMEETTRSLWKTRMPVSN